MTEDLRQRINYLVQHGGLWDDPLEDIRRKLRWALIALAAIGVAEVLTLLVRLA